MSIQQVLESLQVKPWRCDPTSGAVFSGLYAGKWLSPLESTSTYQTYVSVDPTNDQKLGATACPTPAATAVDLCISEMNKAHEKWFSTPAPVRGEVVRNIGVVLREQKDALAQLISAEMGKIYTEALGEVQEFIDICDLACGYSRQIGGKVFPSERPGHFLMENWQPLGNVGIITAFNFPVAVLGWNAAIALVCGNCVLWKPSEMTNLVSIAVTQLIIKAFKNSGVDVPRGVFCMCAGGAEHGQIISNLPAIHLVSFTGSTTVGNQVAMNVAKRFGKVLLELGGNNASIIMPDADLSVVIKACVFAAVGTCGQRCTSLRRLIVLDEVYSKSKDMLLEAYKKVKIGSPIEKGVLCGPVKSQQQVRAYTAAIEEAKSQGGVVLCGGNVIKREGNFVEPTIIEIGCDANILKKEAFVPILYLLRTNTLDEAIKINNSVPQGLSSSLYSNHLPSVFQFIGPLGSDCGIVNVNIGPSGAEIGAAFGGEKHTGGGRESGSDSWKQYMRRCTITINSAKQLQLAQGVEFDV